METVAYFFRKNTWAVILAAIIFSFLFPQVGLILRPFLNYLLGTLMFLSCLDLRIPEIVASLKDVKAISLTLIIVHLVSPVIIFLLRDYFSPEIFLGLIIASVIPAGRSAVFLCNIYGGQPVKALVATSLSNILSPVLVPLLVWLFAHTTLEIDALNMGTTIFWMVITPLIFAFFYGKTDGGKKLNEYSPSISSFIVFLIILGIISPIKNVVLNNLHLTIFLFIIISLLVALNFCLGFFIKKELPDKITYSISSSYKNYTLATLLSLSLFTPLVALPSIVYTIVNNVMLIPFQLLLNYHRLPIHIIHKYKNIFFLIIGIGVTYILSLDPNFKSLLASFGKYGYVSAFFAGMLFASTFTVSIGGLILITLGQHLSPFFLVIIATLGGVSTDFLIFKLFRHQAARDITPIFDKINHKSKLYKLLHTPYFSWTLPVVGLIFIASPLPDELGVSLLGISQIRLFNFLCISAFSHSIGMTTLLLTTHL